MFKICWIIFACMLCTARICYSQTEGTRVKEEIKTQVNPLVLLTTNVGDIKIELYPDKAPKTVANFLSYVNSGFYNDTIFHRIIDGFMIQGGGFTMDFKQKETKPAIENEANNGLPNERGSVSMARTNDPNSATAQFFINLENNEFLNFKSKSGVGWGYAVFGKVIEGMDIVDKIAKVKTGVYGQHRDVPLEPVIILKANEITP